jgi:hypothetical protein
MPTPPFHRPRYLRRAAAWALGLIATGAFLYVAIVLRWVDLGALTGSHLAPWYAEWDPRIGASTAVGLAAAALWLGAIDYVAATRSSGTFLVRALPLALLLWAGVALMDGAKAGESRAGLVETNGLTYPLARTGYEYIGDVPKVEAMGPVAFLRTYHTDEIQQRLAWHSKTHPPGPVLLMWGTARAFGKGRASATAVLLLFGGIAVWAAYGLGRTVLPRDDARAAALLFACTPGVVLFFATSMEAVFTALMLAAAWPLTKSVRDRRLDAALLGGVLLGVATLFTYASVLVAVWTALLWGVTLRRTPDDGRLWSLPIVQILGFALPLLGLAALGYDAVASLAAALGADAQAVGTGTESFLRWAGLGVANVAAWAISFGVASLAVPDREIERTPALLAFAGVLLFAAFSTLFTLEVERIWLPLHALGLTALLGATPRRRRPPLALWAGLLLAQTLLVELLAETRW